MEIRSGAMPDEPDRPGPAVPPAGRIRPADPAGGDFADADPDENGSAPDAAAAGTGPWRADRRLTTFKIIGLVIFVAAAFLLATDPIGTGLLLIAALVCAVYAVRDLFAPVRLAADAEGVRVIHGYLGHTRLSWSDIEKISVDRRSRLGMRSEFLEIDAGEQLYLLSSYDLSAEPADVAAALLRLRTGH